MSEGNRELKIEIDTGNIQAVLKRMTEIEHENKLLLEEKTKRETEFNDEKSKNQALEEKLQNQQGGGSGTLPSALNEPECGKGGVPEGAHQFETYEEMIEWARVNDPKAYAALKKKTASAMVSNPQSFEWKDTFDEQGRSLIGRTLHRANNQKRSRAK
jgi:hypothetical protein